VNGCWFDALDDAAGAMARVTARTWDRAALVARVEPFFTDNLLTRLLDRAMSAPFPAEFMKQFLQRSLRNFHWRFCRRPLPDRLGVYFHTLETDERPAFAEAMQWIQARGYRFVGPGEFLTATGRVCYVSFDDNFRHGMRRCRFLRNSECGRPFSEHLCAARRVHSGNHARFCRTINYRREFTAAVAGRNPELHAAGHWIGAHTHSHVALSRVSRTEAMEDLGKNKSILESIAGSPVTDVAFPFGLPRFFRGRRRGMCRPRLPDDFVGTPGMLFAQGDPLAIHRDPVGLRSWRGRQCEEPRGERPAVCQANRPESGGLTGPGTLSYLFSCAA
jgi:hypothetical protein